MLEYCILGKSSNYTGCYFVHDAVRLFYTEQKHREIDAIITYARFGIIVVEISPADAFLRRVFIGGVNMKNSNLGALFCQV